MALLDSDVTLTDSATIDLTAGAGNRVLAVFCHVEDASATVNSATFDSVAMTAMDLTVQGDDKCRWFYLLEADMPADGAGKAVAVTCSSVPSDVQTHALLFDAAPQGSVIGIEDWGELGTTHNGDITTTEDNALVVAGVGIGNLQTMSTTWGTSLATSADTSSGSRVAYLLDAGTAGDQVIEWTHGGTTNRWVLGTIGFQAGLTSGIWGWGGTGAALVELTLNGW